MRIPALSSWTCWQSSSSLSTPCGSTGVPCSFRSWPSPSLLKPIWKADLPQLPWAEIKHWPSCALHPRAGQSLHIIPALSSPIIVPTLGLNYLQFSEDNSSWHLSYFESQDGLWVTCFPGSWCHYLRLHRVRLPLEVTLRGTCGFFKCERMSKWTLSAVGNGTALLAFPAGAPARPAFPAGAPALPAFHVWGKDRHVCSVGGRAEWSKVGRRER